MTKFCLLHYVRDLSAAALLRTLLLAALLPVLLAVPIVPLLSANLDYAGLLAWVPFNRATYIASLFSV